MVTRRDIEGYVRTIFRSSLSLLVVASAILMRRSLSRRVIAAFKSRSEMWAALASSSSANSRGGVIGTTGLIADDAVLQRELVE